MSFGRVFLTGLTRFTGLSMLNLCRYLGDSVYGLKSIAEGCFRLSRPSSFNDPFDCDGRADGLCGINPKYIVGEDAYAQMRKTPLGLIGICELRSVTKQQWDSPMFVDNIARIMCFTRETASIKSHMLFWSHYANNGRGIRIHFNIPRQVKDVYEIRKVKYVDTLPRCNLDKISRMDRDPEAIAFCDNRIWTKGTAWACEKEYRLRMFVTARDPNFVKVDKASGNMFLQIPAEWISCVDLGPRSELTILKPFIKELKADKRFTHIQFRHASKDPDRYRYLYKEI